jgi:hypothetical protein
MINYMLARLEKPEDIRNMGEKRILIQYFKDLGEKGRVAIQALKKIATTNSNIERCDAENALKEMGVEH